MTYIDGFLTPVPSGRKDAYLAHARKTAEMFREFGALRVVETWPDDVPHGKTTDFHMAVKAEADEAPVFSWIEWPSKAVRDEGWRRVMADPRIGTDMAEMPFDGKRLIYGGFATLLDTGDAS